MPKRFTSPDDGFAPASGFARDDRAGAAARAPRARRTMAVLAAAIGLAGIGAVVAKQAVQAIAVAPADETAAWALMLVGLGMVGLAARRQISAEFTATTRR
jgi:MYXO-CTERM domain-containing protein